MTCPKIGDGELPRPVVNSYHGAAFVSLYPTYPPSPTIPELSLTSPTSLNTSVVSVKWTGHLSASGIAGED